MKIANFAVYPTVLALSIVTGCLVFPGMALADLRVDDRRENAGDGIEDRVEFRKERRDCVGDGPDCRSDNRQDKRDDRRYRAVDRVEDRGERMNNRFERSVWRQLDYQVLGL
jgi:hypothetical protein